MLLFIQCAYYDAYYVVEIHLVVHYLGCVICTKSEFTFFIIIDIGDLKLYNVNF